GEGMESGGGSTGVSYQARSGSREAVVHSSTQVRVPASLDEFSVVGGCGVDACRVRGRLCGVGSVAMDAGSSGILGNVRNRLWRAQSHSSGRWLARGIERKHAIASQ